jgi:paraquat-inducible protein B
MSDDENTDSGHTNFARQRTEAIVRHGWWPGWIWAVPIAVLLVVSWLGIRHLTSGGENIQIVFDNVYGMKKQDTGLVYRGMQVGTVTNIELAGNGDKVIVTVAVNDSATRYLRAGTRFWLKGANPSLGDLSSLGALLSGPTIMMDPGKGKHTRHFKGTSYKPVLPGAPGEPLRYAVSFDAAVGGLKHGDAVSLRDFTVGEVEDVGFRYDASNGQLSTPVTLALYPSLFHIQHAENPRGAVALRIAMNTLIKKGLHASLDRDPPFIGGYRITLKMVPGAGPPKQQGQIGGLPQIPVMPGSGLEAVLSKLGHVPIGKIGQNVLDITNKVDKLVASPKLQDSVVQFNAAMANVLDITHRVDKLVASPELHDSVVKLDAVLTDIHRTMASAGPQITRLIASLRDTASQLDQAAKTVRTTVGGTTSQTSLASTLRELTEAARSIRELADYLNRHPEALIKGRSGE